MKIEHLTEKGSGIVNEDSFLIAPNLYGVFDGATGLIKYADVNGNTGGLIASKTAKTIFERNRGKPLINSIKETSAELMREMKDASINLEDKAGFFATSVSVIRIKGGSIEYLQVADSPIVFIHKNGKLQVFEDDHDLEAMQMRKSLSDQGVKDPHDERLEKLLYKSRRNANVTYGFLNGDDKVLNFTKQGFVLKENIKYILIFTDGMLVPQEDPNKPKNYEKIVQLFQKGGLVSVKNHVRQLENGDPDCVKYPRFKQHDDLTAVAITL